MGEHKERGNRKRVQIDEGEYIYCLVRCLVGAEVGEKRLW